MKVYPTGQGGIRALLEECRQDSLGRRVIDETAYHRAINDATRRAGISLNPAVNSNSPGTARDDHSNRCRARCPFFGPQSRGRTSWDRFLALGMSPKWRRDEIPLMPKHRYAIMTKYMRRLDSHGLDMMFRTCTVQANLDFSSEAIWSRSFACRWPCSRSRRRFSPIRHSRMVKLNGFSFGALGDLAPYGCSRTGMRLLLSRRDFFERYVDYAAFCANVFVKRGDISPRCGRCRFSRSFRG